MRPPPNWSGNCQRPPNSILNLIFNLERTPPRPPKYLQESPDSSSHLSDGQLFNFIGSMFEKLPPADISYDLHFTFTLHDTIHRAKHINYPRSGIGALSVDSQLLPLRSCCFSDAGRSFLESHFSHWPFWDLFAFNFDFFCLDGRPLDSCPFQQFSQQTEKGEKCQWHLWEMGIIINWPPQN